MGSLELWTLEPGAWSLELGHDVTALDSYLGWVCVKGYHEVLLVEIAMIVGISLNKKLTLLPGGYRFLSV